MRKFKLVKTYPNSPKLGTEVETNEYNYVMFKPNTDEFMGIYPDKYPEYWQEVVENTYEILSFKSTHHNDLYIKHENELFAFINDKGHSTDKEVLKHKSWLVHSVKRLSDGQIFTIGDTVSCGISIDIIKELKINNNTIYVSTVNGTFGQNIENIEIYKKPIIYCITEDEYEITSELENLYWVNDKFNIYTKKAGNCKSNVKYHRYRKSAENYIKCHKPVLNYNEVLELLDEVYRKFNHTLGSRSYYKDQLTKLVKSKLNMND